MKKFAVIPITKVDEVQRLVYGTAAIEQVDKSNEILDYASSKPRFEAWSGEIFKASDGKSLGNVREMHLKSAVGKLAVFTPDDATKSFIVAAKVIDDQAWAKVVEGVYTGFSLGGSYERRWDDPVLKGVKRYTANPSEISLVDNPCIPGATFEMIKADGAKELRKFAPAVEGAEAKFSLMRRVIASGIEQGEDMKKLASNCIANYYPQTVSLFKSMYDVSRLADALSAIAWIEDCLECERDYSGIDTKVPEMLGDMLIQFKPIFLALAEEEISRLVREEEREAAAKLFFDVNAAMTKIASSHALNKKGVTDMTRLEALEALEKAVLNSASLEQLKKDLPELFAKAKSTVKEGESTADDLKNKKTVKEGEGAPETDKAVTDSLNKVLGGEGITGLMKRLEKLDQIEQVVKSQGEAFEIFVQKVCGTPVMAAAAAAAGAPGLPVAKGEDGNKPADTNLKKKASDYTRAELAKMDQDDREKLIVNSFKEAQGEAHIGQPFPTH